MELKPDLFLRGIKLLKRKQKQPEEVVVPKTLRARARDELRKIGVDRDTDYHFGDRIKPFFISQNLDYPKNFNTEQAQTEYISNPNNWVLVHATNYMPNDNHMQTTAMASDWTVPRATIHFTLNHIVQSHMGGNWDNRPIVILTPFKDTIQTNGNPVGFALFDTYFSPDVKSGLELPKSARVVHPGVVPDGLLFQIKDNETIYKADNYTNDEIQEILSIMPPETRQMYINMENGILSEGELDKLFQSDYTGHIEKSYNLAKDKQAFLSGITAETRYKMLIHFVKHMAVNFTMDRMGFKELTYLGDVTKVSAKAADVAMQMGIKHASASNKGHHNSMYNRMEEVYMRILGFKDRITDGTIEEFQIASQYYKEPFNILADSIIENRPVTQTQMYEIFTKDFDDFYKRYYEKYYGPCASIEQYDKNLATTIKRYCEFQANELNDIIKTIKQKSEFLKIINDFYVLNHNKINISHER